MSEPRALPVPPRTVRWRAALARGWPLGLGAAALLVCGLAMIAFNGAPFALPFDELALDEGASRTDATITAVEPDASHDDWTRVDYSFIDLSGATQRGTCSGPADGTAVGDVRVVEFLADSPATHRLRGWPRAAAERSQALPLGLVVLPSLLLLAVWLRGAVALRLLLTSGTEGAATVTRTAPGALPFPRQMLVEYRFEADGRPQSGRQWMHPDSTLGRRALDSSARLAVVYDAQDPSRHRLTGPEAFSGPA